MWFFGEVYVHIYTYPFKKKKNWYCILLKKSVIVFIIDKILTNFHEHDEF